ncbi:MAG: VWA domain-containing protein, partial [Solirubrobacteraceae bacterium]
MPQIPLADGTHRSKAPAKPKPFKLAMVRLSNTCVLPGSHTVWAQVDLTAPKSPENKRANVDIAPVIDCSGSMGRGPGSPREHAFDAVRYLLKRLGGRDRSALVLYDAHVEVVKGLSSDHQAGVERLRTVAFGGLTALADGLYTGLEQLSGARSAKGRTQCVFLLSDGLANQGDTDASVIAGKVAKAAKAGIKVATFGLGPQYDED